MNGRTLARSLAAAAATLLVAGEVFGIVTTGFDSGSVFIWGITLAFGATGTVVASRQPRNPIGWIFLTAALAAGIGNLAGAYAEFYVADREGSELLARVAAEYGEVSWMPFMLLPTTFLLALFPDGRLLSPRWRWVAWCAGIGIGGGFVASALIAGPIPDRPELTNPFGIDHPVIEPLNGLAMITVAVAMIGSSVSLILRFRRSRGIERQQMKWLALAGAVAVGTVVVGVAGYEELGEALANALMMLAVMGLPVAAGIAILRFRLYDVDLVINRALVYSALTGLLAATYLGAVLLLQVLLEGLTEGSGLAVAVSTLGTAAVVRPARARIQSAVDRRFFRRRYDAARTVDRFGSRLRERVDLESLHRDLGAVVAETVQPEHVSLWFPERTRAETS